MVSGETTLILQVEINHLKLQKTVALQSRNVTKLYFANSKVKKIFKSFDFNNIFYYYSISTNRGIGDTRKGIKKNDIYVNCNFVVWQKNVS